MAFGAMMALARKADEGGSWHVRVSLAQRRIGCPASAACRDGFTGADPKLADVADLLDETDTPAWPPDLRRHAAVLSETPAHWARPPVPLGTHAPVWPE